ncbi:hypothetical protein [Nocardioides sp. zg-1228]|uniref:hypothetical protein n=1 Tax=Nocardioides sp. zg-1228 TaxID=2763008 RepID=UPI001642BDEC|nr:hypothetical protein [Nocardioides sp. zg-1228]MBC2933811.1 hypothetical protein [Nocardioides sp. zg-1228]QSF58584.1 hypothetical protein JX575_05140 [Nocardioides sp. zg-1228]
MSTPDLVAVLLATLVLAGIGAVQVLAAAGRPCGRLVWGGRHEVLPRGLRVGSALSVPLYAAAVGALLVRAGAWGRSGTEAEVVAWALVGYFAIGIVLNAISRSRPERLTMTPACVVLTACCLVVASG